MERFRSNYSILYRELRAFLDLVVTRLKKGSPKELAAAPLIPTVLPEDDRDFSSENKDNMAAKMRIVLEASTAFMDKIVKYIGKEHEGWLKDQSKKLIWRINVVRMSMQAINVKDTGPQIAAMLSAMGATNSGVSYNINSETLYKLQDMFKILLKD